MDKYYFSVGSLHSYSAHTEDRYCASLFNDLKMDVLNVVFLFLFRVGCYP